MCDICQHNPHLSGCPNAPDPVPVLACVQCGEGIWDGDRFLDLDSGPVCMDCLRDMTVEEVLGIVGERLSVAQGGY